MDQSSLEARLAIIEARNARVEADKAWETSWARKIAIMLLTYGVVLVYLAFVIGIEPWLNALVPVVGFLLSTITIGKLKEAWIARRDMSKER